MSQNKIVCVTGGTGFVGRGVVPVLLAAGFQVHALVRRGSESKLPRHPNLTAFEGDVLSAACIEEALTGCDALVHLVGIRRHDTKKTGLSYEDVDLGSAKAALRSMKSTSVQRIVLLSAADIGQSVYVQTKKKVEAAVLEADVDWTILRPSYILGDGQQWPRIMSPMLDTFALLPGHFGDVAKRARCVTREQLGNTIVESLRDEQAIGRILDVTDMRRVG